MGRRTETSYKDEFSGKSAQYDKVPDSGDTVNDAVVQRKIMFLSGDAWPMCGSVNAEQRSLGNMENDRTGVSRGHSSPPMQDEGLNSKKENSPASSEATKNPTGGVSERRIVDQPDSDVNLLEQIL